MNSIYWPDKTLPMEVFLAPGVLTKLETAARDGLLAMPRTGLCVGGLLLGTREASSVHVTESVGIPCSHAMGPSFTLTPDEVETSVALRASLEGDADQPTVVGWYRSKTSGALEAKSMDANSSDQALFDALCPEPWQAMMLLQPVRSGPTLAAFGFREFAGEHGTRIRFGEAGELLRHESESVPSGMPETDWRGLADFRFLQPIAPSQSQPPDESLPAAIPAQPPEVSVADQLEAPPAFRARSPYIGTLFVPPEPKRKASRVRRPPRRIVVATVVLAILCAVAFITGYLSGHFRMKPASLIYPTTVSRNNTGPYRLKHPPGP